MYCFLWLHVTNYHILGGLQQQKFLLSQFWRPEVSPQFHLDKIKTRVGLSSLRGLSGRILFIASPAPSEGCLLCQGPATSLHFFLDLLPQSLHCLLPLLSNIPPLLSEDT